MEQVRCVPLKLSGLWDAEDSLPPPQELDAQPVHFAQHFILARLCSELLRVKSDVCRDILRLDDIVQDLRTAALQNDPHLPMTVGDETCDKSLQSGVSCQQKGLSSTQSIIQCPQPPSSNTSNTITPQPRTNDESLTRGASRSQDLSSYGELSPSSAFFAEGKQSKSAIDETESVGSHDKISKSANSLTREFTSSHSTTNERQSLTATSKLILESNTPSLVSQNSRIMDHSVHLDSNHPWILRWESGIGSLILLNAVFLGWVTEAKATHNLPSESIIDLVTIFFAVVFSIDLLLRVGLQRVGFFKGKDRYLNMFDVVVVVSMYPDLFGIDEILSISALRIFRLLRLLRVVRALRLFRFFSEFRLMIWAIAVALRALFWIMCVCWIFIYMAGLGMTDACLGYCTGRRDDESVCKYFGTIGSSMLTLYQAILGGLLWGDILSALEPLDLVTKGFFIWFVSCCLIVIMNISAACVLDIVREVNSKDREASIDDELETRRRCITALQKMFREIDANSSGAISFDELAIALGDERMEAVLSACEINVDDIERLFKLLDVDDTNAVSAEEFVLGCYRLKGEARTIDVVSLQREVDTLRQTTLAIKDYLMPEVPAEQQGKDVATEQEHGGSDPISHMQAAANSRFWHSSSNIKSTASITRSRVTSSDSKARGCRIEKVEERAMLLTELQQVRKIIKKQCTVGSWTNPATDEPLDPQQVDLYQFAFYYICPRTVPDGITICGLQPVKYSAGEVVSQPGTRMCAEGVVLEDSNDGNVRVRVLCGRFESSEGGRHREITVENVKRGVPNKLDAAGCISYKEAVARAPQKPLWFCSHWWGERIFHFVLCCEEHARRRAITPASASYWVCGYALRQYELSEDVSTKIQDTAFFKAIKLSAGILLVLDENATPFKRIWCDFEIFQSLVGESELKFDIATVTCDKEEHVGHILSCGRMPNESARDKAKRESTFPLNILARGLEAKLENGSASAEDDRTRIMSYITKDSRDMDALERANRTLNAFFAQAAWPQAVKKNLVLDFDDSQPGELSLPEVMVQDLEMKQFIMSLEHMEETTDYAVADLSKGIPPNVRELNLSFEGCTKITSWGVAALANALPRNLRVLKLDFLGCRQIEDDGVEALAKALPRSLQTIWLHFDKCEGVGLPSIKALAENVPSGAVFKGTFKDTAVDRNCASVAELKRLAKQSA